MPRKTPGPACVVCGTPSHAKGLCYKHLSRLRKHGDTDTTLRPPDWGERSKHPLNGTWKHTARNTAGRVDRWDDIWNFVADVGSRPGFNYKLKRLRPSEPWGPENFFWQPNLSGTKASDDRNAYARTWRAANLYHCKDSDMRRRYGISLSEYDALLAAQGGGCAICGCQQGDDYYRLAVDHCHDTKVVRGILCGSCNRAIGSFKERLELVERAAVYLRRTQG